ncbi:uncharacterized protein LOC111048513 isoform X2 [Nilaparvata lugens]|uniref:uncharacterized protein LOC111048513 isoform X2 n=1 Tax=Nilaparvata lugens TaxID=108931 RepID=UPI00193E34FF|nr:uncharacterized protein LOC111048513 isoform X2 [Nilaparvata lugens]
MLRLRSSLSWKMRAKALLSVVFDCIAWLCFTLVEGSLISCLGSLLLDASALCEYYRDDALLKHKRLTSLFLYYIHELSSIILILPSGDRMADAGQPVENDNKDGNISKASNNNGHVRDVNQPIGARLAANRRPCLDLLTNDRLTNGESMLSPIDSGVSLVDCDDVDNTSISDMLFENCKSEDDLLFTSMEDSGIIWSDSNVLQADLAGSCSTQIYNGNLTPSLIINNNLQGDPKEVIEQEANHSVNKQQSVEVEKTEDDCDEEIVFRRTKGRRAKKGDKQKRVSFHEGDVTKSVVGEGRGKGPVERRPCYSWCVDDLASYARAQAASTNGEDCLQSDGLVGDESSATLSDSEVGVEVDCDSSSTLEEDLPTGSRKFYDKWTTTLKQLSGLKKTRHDDKTMPEVDMFSESTSSLNSAEVSSAGKVLKKLWAEKQPAIGKMLKTISGQLMPVSEGQLLDERGWTNDKRALARSGSTLEWSSDSEWSSEVEENASGDRLKRRSLSGNRRRVCRSLFSSKLLQEASSKTSLVNRFLQSIPETKPAKVQLALNRKRMPLYIEGVECDPLLNDEVLQEIRLEMQSHKPEKRSSVEVDDNLANAITTYTLQSPQEKIYKVYQVSSLDGLPLLCVMTNSTLYLTGISPINRGFSNHHVIHYSQLSSIIVGPNSQVMMLAAVDKSQRVTVLATLGRQMVDDLLAHLELAVRRALGQSPLSIRQLHLSDMTELKKLVVKQSSVQKDEELEHYVWVNVGNANAVTAGSTPLGPTKAGHLMFRPHKRSQWLPGYCLLKGGVLYVFADADQRLPQYAVGLHSGQCCGCRRVPPPAQSRPRGGSGGAASRSTPPPAQTRPHTFEILLPRPGHTFQLAAADEYEVSDWLQAFVQAASHVDSDTNVICDELAEAVTGCALLLTTRHILTVAFPPQKVHSCVALHNLSSVKLAHNCCVLETGCKEMDEGGGDWIVYFATDVALEEFLDCLVRLQPSLAQSVVMMSDSDPLSSRCEQTSRLLEECWDLLLHPRTI